MSETTDLEREVEALRERLAKLSEASLSISESLDFETVLLKVLDSARELTGARYGHIVTVDEKGDLEAFLTSGPSEEEHRQMVALPGVEAIAAHFLAATEPLRMDDWSTYASSAGLNPSAPINLRAGLFARSGTRTRPWAPSSRGTTGRD